MMAEQETQTWISVSETASLLKVKPRTVIRRIEKGTLLSRPNPDIPFTEDGRENYEVRLEALPSSLQYRYLYSHLPQGEISSLDLVSPRSALGNVWLEEFLHICGILKKASLIREENKGTGEIKKELKALADESGISLSGLYRILGKPSAKVISSLYLDPFYLSSHLPRTMCLWSCDLSYALFLNKESHYSQNAILSELWTNSSTSCAICPYKKEDDTPQCREKRECMKTPNNRKAVNRLLKHVPPQLILYARKGFRAWRAKYGLFIQRERPLLVNESFQGDHHKFDLFCRITITKEHNGRKWEKEIAVRPTLTAWMESTSGCIVGWVISVTPNSDTIAEAFSRAVTLKPGLDFRGLPKIVIVDCGKDYRSKLIEDMPKDLSSVVPDDTFLNRRFSGIGLLPALGVTVQHTLVYHPQSKPIERFFGTIEKKWISKLPGWCTESIDERPQGFQKTLDTLLKEKKLLTLEEFVTHFKNVILPAYHNTIDNEEPPEAEGDWKPSHSSLTPLEIYRTTEKVSTLTPDWPTISILKLHHSPGHKVSRWGIRFSNTYYQADEMASVVGSTVDILYHRVQPPFAPSSITVIHNSKYLCEAFSVEKRHLSGDNPVDIMHECDRQLKPARDMAQIIKRIKASTEAILPEKAKSQPDIKSELADMIWSDTVEEETKKEEEKEKKEETESVKKESIVQKGLSFLFGEE